MPHRCRLQTEALISGTWTPVTSDTLFPKGTNTTVRFRFRDASGNTGNSHVGGHGHGAHRRRTDGVQYGVAMGGGRLHILAECR